MIKLSGKEFRVENNRKCLRIEVTTTSVQAFVDEVQSHLEEARNNLASREAHEAQCSTVKSVESSSKVSRVQHSKVQETTVQTQNSTVHYGAAQYSTAQYITVQYSTVQYSTVHFCIVYSTVCVQNRQRQMHSTVQYQSLDQFNTLQHSTAQYFTVQYIKEMVTLAVTIQYSTAWYSTM